MSNEIEGERYYSGDGSEWKPYQIVEGQDVAGVLNLLSNDQQATERLEKDGYIRIYHAYKDIDLEILHESKKSSNSVNIKVVSSRITFGRHTLYLSTDDLRTLTRYCETANKVFAQNMNAEVYDEDNPLHMGLLDR